MVTIDLTKDGPLRHTFKAGSIKKFCHDKAIEQNRRHLLGKRKSSVIHSLNFTSFLEDLSPSFKRKK